MPVWVSEMTLPAPTAWPAMFSRGRSRQRGRGHRKPVVPARRVGPGGPGRAGEADRVPARSGALPSRRGTTRRPWPRPTRRSPIRTALDAVIALLDGPTGAALSHAEMEERLTVQGRDLLRQLYQDHLDLRAEREPRGGVVAQRATRSNSGWWRPFGRAAPDLVAHPTPAGCRC